MKMWYYLIILTFSNVFSKDLFSNSLSLTEQCQNLCKEFEQFPDTIDENAKLLCESGCRFFNLIHFRDEQNINVTKKGCFQACKDSYTDSTNYEICTNGCNLTANHREQKEIVSFLLVSEDSDNDNGIVLAEPDLEIFESDLVFDPTIKNQLEMGQNVDYKIPETYIRTMPINKDEEDDTSKSNQYNDWLSCASRSSGIPRWFLLIAILAAILIALWLSFSTEKKYEDDDEKLIIENDEIADPLPQKYHIESEKV